MKKSSTASTPSSSSVPSANSRCMRSNAAGTETDVAWEYGVEVHSKRRNHLKRQKMNDLVYVVYSLKLSGREERKRKEDDFGVEQHEMFEDVDSDDGWITEDNEDLTNMYVNEPTTDGANGDSDFLEHAIRNQFGGNEQSREESSYVFEDGNEVEAAEQLEIID
ncbi:hypothetical protein CTI12_AA409660 [Artemisia annua]|uniref:Uncharacterized protein n=1 Tax=Artemisia annua TaxID=35608 RepID=A0A2U1M975_ARTAN|nr:hypothetical protein CTI12_AA409660 [Artemisia annua]